MPVGHGSRRKAASRGKAAEPQPPRPRSLQAVWCSGKSHADPVHGAGKASCGAGAGFGPVLLSEALVSVRRGFTAVPGPDPGNALACRALSRGRAAGRTGGAARPGQCPWDPRACSSGTARGLRRCRGRWEPRAAGPYTPVTPRASPGVCSRSINRRCVVFALPLNLPSLKAAMGKAIRSLSRWQHRVGDRWGQLSTFLFSLFFSFSFLLFSLSFSLFSLFSLFSFSFSFLFLLCHPFGLVYFILLFLFYFIIFGGNQY